MIQEIEDQIRRRNNEFQCLHDQAQFWLDQYQQAVNQTHLLRNKLGQNATYEFILPKRVFERTCITEPQQQQQ